MNRILLPISLGLLVVVVTFLISDFVQEIIIMPLLKIFRFVENLPQDLLWFFFIGIIILFAFKSLIKWDIKSSEVRYSKIRRKGQTEELMDLIRDARDKSYFKQLLAQYLYKLTLEILAYRERIKPDVVKDRLESGTEYVPSEILAYLLAGQRWDFCLYSKKGKGHFRSNAPDSPLELDPEKVVEFLEQQLGHQLEVYRGLKDR